MRTIAVVNQKGGCGKTTVSINLASALAEFGKKVLLVDMDPQSHCAVGLAVPEQQIEQSIYDVLISRSRNEPIRLQEILWQINDRLSIAGNTGCFFASPGGDYFNLFTQSASAAVSLTDRLGTYHEWYVLAFDGAEDSRPQHFYNGGITYLVTPNFQLDWRAGFGLNDASDDFFTGPGLIIRR